MADYSDITEVAKKSSRKKDYAVGGIALAGTLALCIAVVFYWDYIIRVQQYGYLGVFIISILAGGTVFVPVPGLLVIFTLGSVLNPILVGAVGGLGEAIGSIGIYLSGFSGQRAFQNTNHQFVTKFTDWLRRRGSLTIFAMSAIFNPLFYPLTAVAGMLRYGLIKFFFLCLAGKIVKNIAVAYLGYFGLGTLLRWMGIIF